MLFEAGAHKKRKIASTDKSGGKDKAEETLKIINPVVSSQASGLTKMAAC